LKIGPLGFKYSKNAESWPQTHLLVYLEPSERVWWLHVSFLLNEI